MRRSTAHGPASSATASEGLLLFYGVVNKETESVVEFFLEREQAEAFIAEVEQDEPEMAALMRIEEIEFEDVLN